MNIPDDSLLNPKNMPPPDPMALAQLAAMLAPRYPDLDGPALLAYVIPQALHWYRSSVVLCAIDFDGDKGLDMLKAIQAAQEDAP